MWVSLLLAGLLVLVMAYIRLRVYPTQIVPLTYGLPLLLCLWDRNLWTLYGMSILFSGVALMKLFVRSRLGVLGEMGFEVTQMAMMMANIWIVTGVVHAVLHTRALVELRTHQLEVANAELEANNEELASREEEIAGQNEELQAQTEELEQQAEELRQQTEELETQSSDLQRTNDELNRREKGLQTLLDSARWLRSDLAEQDVMSAVCQAAVEVMDDKVDAAAIIQEKDGRIWLRGQSGFGLHGTIKHDFDFSRSFASLVIESKRTAYIQDLATREDIETPRPAVGQPFQSVIASPIWAEGRIIGAVEIYSRKAREWTEDDFSVAEWLAAQTALALQTIDYQKELEIKRREAEEASVHKTRFLAAVSHDVRTPANAISLMADLVERMGQDPSRLNQIPPMVKNLKANARALVELVSDVLDLARFDSGKLELQISDFSLAAVVDAEFRQFHQSAEGRGLKLVNHLLQTPLWLRTDKMKLARILANLIGNAVKFTEVGEIRVSAQSTPDGDVLVSIADTGVGMPSEQLPRIFDEFYQLQNPERDRNKGTGLGLAICRRLVESLGCSMTVESAIGVGTTFIIRLPREIVLTPAAASERPMSLLPQEDRSSDSLRGVQVLLVEDHDATRAATALVLEAHGAEVIQTSTCRTALHALAHESPQVLLLDMMLPDHDGTDVLRYLQKQRPKGLRCVLAVSGDVRQERVNDVKRLGADDLLPKPLTSEVLLEGIRKYLTPRPTDGSFLDTLGKSMSPVEGMEEGKTR